MRLTGVVTHVNKHENDFWMQDAKAGIYVHPTGAAAQLEQGDLVEVEGTSSEGAFSPCVNASRVQKLGKGELPIPLPFDLSAGESRWMDGQWVQAWVVIRGAYTDHGTTRLEAYTSQGVGTLVVPGEEWAIPAKELRDAAVVVRGVCVPTFKNRMIAGPPNIYLAALPEVPPTPPNAPDGPDGPVRLIDLLLRFAPPPHAGGRRVKIAGVVTAAPVPGMLIVQDSTGAATVWPDVPGTDVPVGSRVEAYGLLRIDGTRVTLTRAAVKVFGSAAFPEPVPAHPDELAARDSILVKLAARVEKVSAVGNWTAVTLLDGVFRFEAYVPGAPDINGLHCLQIGSRVEVAGVPVDATPDGKPGSGPGLFLRGADAVSVLEPPTSPPPLPNVSWWTTTRVAYLTIGFLAMAIVGGAWLWALRVRVRQAAGEIQQQYEEKAKLEKQLRQAAKLEAVGRLAGGIAHDFNNLLTVINGCAEMLGDEAKGAGGRVIELTDDIRRAGERAAALTGQLLTFSRKREVRISAVNINEVVTDTARLLARVIGEDIRIETSLAASLPPVQAEPGLLHQVIMNLAVNARDAMPQGGTLTLGTAFIIDVGDTLGGSSVPLGSAPRKYVRLVVSDTGVGMSEEVKARVFEPFFTTKEIGKGTGLGLATVYGIIQSLSGKIRVDSAVGRGTTFQIDLRVHGDPISDADITLPPATPLPASRVQPAMRLNGTTVLVVEDNEMVRDLLVSGLTTDGATVLSADRPEQALRVLAEYPNGVDVLVTDVVMPGMNGRDLAERVRAAQPRVRVLFMSGYTADEVLRQGVLEDQVEFLQKPFTPDHLTSRLLRVLGRSS